MHEMHRCLTIVEVQRTIFRELYDQSGGPATLARLARTCRAFNTVALDVLWVTLDSFVYLVKCLPRDLWRIDPVDKEMIFQRPMSFRDWSIFFGYSSRIRNLRRSVGPEFITRCLSLGQDVIFALSNPPTHGPLIPYLRALSWDKPDKKHASLLRLLLTPSLRFLSLSSCSLQFPEVSILTSVGAMCPSLRTLCITPHELSTNSLDAQGQKILSGALLYLHSLESLTCPTLDAGAIVHLSRLPSLSHLSLELRHDIRLEEIRPYVATPAFASIDSLTLRANALSTLTSLLESMHFNPTSVSFIVTDVPTTDALRLFFLALAGACDSESLSSISLETLGKRQSGSHPRQVTLSTFQSLLAFPNIHFFEFDVECDVLLDDNALATFAKHWPDVRAFSINAKSGWGIPPRTTHRGLIAFLASYPELSYFALAFDFSDVDKSYVGVSGTRPGVFYESYLAAEFVTSTIVYPITIAAFLSGVCPDLEVVGSAWQPGVRTEASPQEANLFKKRWDEVRELLPAFSAVRRQSIEWAEEKAKESSVIRPASMNRSGCPCDLVFLRQCK